MAEVLILLRLWKVFVLVSILLLNILYVTTVGANIYQMKFPHLNLQYIRVLGKTRMAEIKSIYEQVAYYLSRGHVRQGNDWLSHMTTLSSHGK